MLLRARTASCGTPHRPGPASARALLDFLREAPRDRATGLLLNSYDPESGNQHELLVRVGPNSFAAMAFFQDVLLTGEDTYLAPGLELLAGLIEHFQRDGVFGIGYGKGPGVDRAGDGLKHGNAYGSSPHGGVLVVAGDDHGCVSSSMPHQSDVAFLAWLMPNLNPANIAEYLEYGLYGIALSRFSGM